METNDRILGELQEFKRASIKRLDRIDSKLENLNSFKWKVIGFSAALSIGLSMFIDLMR